MAGRRIAGLGPAIARLTVIGGLLGATVVVAPAWYVRAVTEGRMASVDEVPAQPVALVLGAEVYADGQPSRYLRARLDVARELFAAGKVRAFLVSGDGTRHYSETDGMRDYLIEHGVPADRIVGDHSGFDTYDSCVRAKRIFGVSSAIVVSQTYHLPRALAICRAIGLDAWGVGDESVKTNEEMWSYGTVRELGANLKMVWDVLSRRAPVLGAPDDSVQRALRD
ncbi:MAG: ElyC/SanA/YdcF family protein [Micropruina sp.]|uniref:SanA/YdcF family protein n=1 Tax=Micropruina sp. TaxID=2737536 RepID=UPI0039E226D5